jgi:nicotinamide-nucleotide amidase
VSRPLRVESLAVGDELLDGRLADTNSRTLADALSPLGVTLGRAVCVDDDVDVISDAVREAAVRADIVVTSGGLGPTTDDLTAEGVARAAGCELRLDEPTMEFIRARFAERGLDMPDNNRRQAEVPQTARVVKNGAGIAPGFVTRVGGAEVWSFPGVPREYRWLLDNALLPALRERVGAGAGVVARRTLRCLGITESGLGAALETLLADHPEVQVQYRTSFPENHARLVVRADTAAAADERADALAAQARAAIGGAAYAVGEQPLEALVVERLVARGQTVALAESCTGGLIGKLLTDVPGASSALVGGVIAYANDVKERELDVDAGLIAEHGAVSEEVAGAMAIGARARLGADWALAVTGVAGPDGGTDDKPVGTVCFGLASAHGVETKRRLLLGTTRDMIRQLAAAVALRWLYSRAAGPDAEHAGPVAT